MKSQLETLPDRTRHDIMVPIGSKSGQMRHYAFMPGYVQHTNEVTVLLGDNWFAERSAKQASEIAQRRIDKCDVMLSKFLQEKDHLEKWLDYVGKMRGEEDEVELIEEYDEDAEELWREEHKAKVKAQKQKEARERIEATKIAHDDMMVRLDSLELLEKNEGLAASNKTKVNKSVSFADESENSGCETSRVVSEDKHAARPEVVNPNKYADSDAQQAFTGEIVERQVAVARAATGAQQQPSSDAPAKRVSKFKQSRT